MRLHLSWIAHDFEVNTQFELGKKTLGGRKIAFESYIIAQHSFYEQVFCAQKNEFKNLVRHEYFIQRKRILVKFFILKGIPYTTNMVPPR